MSYKNNGCPDCTKDKLCPRCYLGMIEFEFESAKRKLIETQKVVGNHIQNISYWDRECCEAMSKVELFRNMLKEKNELSNGKTEQESEG